MSSILKDTEIMDLIQQDKISAQKRYAQIGVNYYEGEHDIRNYKLYYHNADGKLVEDKTRSNIKISHPFFTELVDQEVQYMLSGKESFVKSDNTELQEKLDEYFDDDFTAELQELLTGTVCKGFDYLYSYKNSEGKTRFQYADSMGVVPVRKKQSDDGCEYVIYWYVDRVDKDSKPITKIQVWTDSEIHFFKQVGDEKLEKDDSIKTNPVPHVVRVDDKGERYGSPLGYIPFFRLDNGRKQTSGLKPVKELIDDYDLMSCGLSNNLQDASEYLVVVSGYQGSDLDELITNTKTKKHIGVDADGGVEFKTVNVPYDARKVKLELDEKNIYRFGMGFNSAQLGDGNITNIVIKSRYALLDLKCNKLEIRLRQFLKKILKIVIAEINQEYEAEYKLSDVYIDFIREVMTNAEDNAKIKLTDAQVVQAKIDTILNIAAIVDSETIIKGICDILELDYDDVSSRMQEEDETEQAEQVVNKLEQEANTGAEEAPQE